MVAELILVPDIPDDPERGADGAKAGARHVARALSAVGFKVREQLSVCSGKGDFQKAISAALGRSNIVVTMGGLGRESGGMAKSAVAQGLGLPLEADRACYLAIENYCQRTGDPFLPGDAALAQIPRGSIAFPSKYGKIPGIVISSKNQHIVMLPAAEQDAVSILTDSVIPHIQGKTPQSGVTRTLRTYGVSEEMVRRTLAEVMGSPNPAVTVHKEGNEVLVRVTGRSSGSTQAAAVCTPVLRRIVELLGDAAYGLDVESLQAAVVDKLKHKELELAVAESGCSGMLTRVLTETRGGADVLRYSVFAEDDAAKIERLGLSSKLLKKHGGVSEEAVVAMADAARKKARASIAAALTIGGGQDGRSPHGLVYIAVCSEDSVYVKKLVIGSGDAAERDLVMDAALSRALNMIRLFVDYYPKWHMGSIPLEEALRGRTVTDLASYDDPLKDAPREKTGFLQAFFGNFILRKADRPGVKVKKFIFILAMLVLIGSGSYVGYYLWGTHRSNQLAQELQDMFTYGDMDAEIPDSYPRAYIPKFAALYAKNEDVVAYISIPDTKVSYPVVQAEDNDYYLRRDYNKNSAEHGVPFLDYRAGVQRASDNLVVYGHNMKDGRIFGEVMYYNVFDQKHGGQQALDFYKEHPVIDFTTVYQDTSQYKIFAVFITNADSEHGPVFDYHNFIDAKSDADFQSYIDQLRQRSIIDTGVDVQPGDKLLTLSTCTYEFTDARFVVVARKLRRNESPEVDGALVERNKQPLMPDIWYDLFGGSRPEGISPNANVVTQAAQRPPSSSAPPASSLTMLSSSRPEDKSSSVPSSSVPASSSSASSQVSSQPSSTAPAPAPPVAQATAPSPEPEPPPPESSEEEPPEILYDESEAEEDELPETRSFSQTFYDELTVTAGGRSFTGDALDIVARTVQNEIGASFDAQAIKAHAVATYTYICFYNNQGSSPSVILASSADAKVENAVAEVLGQAVYHNGKMALTPYHATSAGSTTSSKDVWGGHYPYLVPVDSAVDINAPGYESRKYLTRDQVYDILQRTLGITPDDDPERWFEILSYADGDYVGNVSVCGYTASPKTGTRLTGRYLRESVFGLRSACFTVDYDPGLDRFAFTTYGYGHGVGLSQNGAQLYALQGWDYVDILTHYFPGTEVY